MARALALARSGFMQADLTPLSPVLHQKAWPEALAFEAALLRVDQGEALALMNRAMDDGHSLVEVEMHMIQPALYRIGERWQANQITVAQEHMASALVQMVMPMGLLRSPPPIPLNKRVLLACVDGNNHSIGLAMVSDAFTLSGWQVQYLGADVPTTSLVAQVLASRPDLVGLSVSFPQHLRIAKQVIAELITQMGDTRPAVMIGGLAVNRFSVLDGALGADACGGNAMMAVQQANQMLGAA
jgi:methanogenic corrinoid protein MtbC1